LAYLEGLAKDGTITKDDHFLCAFGIRGHTHNRQDAANKEPSGKYYSWQEITTHLHLLTAIRSLPGSKYSAKIHWPLYDFASVIAPCLNKQNKKNSK